MIFENIYSTLHEASVLHAACHDPRKPLDTPHMGFKQELFAQAVKGIEDGDYLDAYKDLARLAVQTRSQELLAPLARLLRSSVQVCDQLERVVTILIAIIGNTDSDYDETRNQIREQEVREWVAWTANKLEALVTSPQCVHFEGPITTLRPRLDKLRADMAIGGTALFGGHSRGRGGGGGGSASEVINVLEHSRDLLISLRSTVAADIHETTIEQIRPILDKLRVRLKERRGGPNWLTKAVSKLRVVS